MGKPQIKPRSSRSTAEKGVITCKPENHEVLLNMNTSTAYLNMKETLALMLSMNKAAHTIWKEQWVKTVEQVNACLM